MELFDVIQKDCQEWVELKDGGFLYYLYVNKCKNSEESGMYQLILNGEELWWGTLEEINAIVKSMITREVHKDFLED